jgi:hypothetical protein
MLARGGLHQLHRDPQRSRRPAHAAFQQVSDLHRRPSAASSRPTDSTAKIDSAAITPNAGKPRQLSDEVLHKPDRKPRIVGRARQVLERQDGDQSMAVVHDADPANTFSLPMPTDLEKEDRCTDVSSCGSTRIGDSTRLFPTSILYQSGRSMGEPAKLLASPASKSSHASSSGFQIAESIRFKGDFRKGVPPADRRLIRSGFRFRWETRVAGSQSSDGSAGFRVAGGLGGVGE